MTRRRLDYCIPAALFTTLFCYLYWSLTGSLYIYLDNMTVAMVSSGMFGSRYFCQYIHPLLDVVIHTLSPVFPFADVFALFVHIALLGSVYTLSLLGYRMVLFRPVKAWKITNYLALMLLILSVLFFTLGLNIWGVNYTVQTGAVLFAGLVTLSAALEKKEGKAWITAGTILFTAGYLLRPESGLLFIPFIGLEILAGFLRSLEQPGNNKGEARKEMLKYLLNGHLRYYGPALLIAVLLLASRTIFWCQAPYASDNRYNTYRTVVEDYPMNSYAASGAEAYGIDEVTYNLVSGSWVLLDTERIDTECLKGMAESGSRKAFEYSPEGLKEALKAMVFRLRTTDIYLFMMTVMTVMLTLRNLAAARSKWLKAEAVLGFLGGFIILLYFTFQGRALFRVWQTVLLAVDAVLVCNAMHIGRERSESGRKMSLADELFLLVLCIPLYYSAGQMIAHTELHGPISPLTSRVNADDSAYAETWAGSGLYLWSNWYLTIPVHFADQNKLPTQRVVDHNIPVGDWTYGQVYFREYLEKRNAPNPARALIERPETYLMDHFEGNLMIYMKHFYGEDLELKEAGEINGVTAYRLERGTNRE